MKKTRYILGRRPTIRTVIVIMLLLGISCKKLTEVPPPSTSLTAGSVYASDATAISALTGLYAELSQSSANDPGPFLSLSLATGLSGDEMVLWSGVINASDIAYYTNNLNTAVPSGSEQFWNNLYPYVFACNDAIAGLNAATSLTPAVKQQLLGEAYFMRAYFYFYLTNLYGDVPLALTNDYHVNESLARSPQTKVYQQIITDLKQAQTLLSSTYLDQTLLNSTTEKVRPTSWAATALLARVYLYYGDLSGDIAQYAGAETQATALIGNQNYNLSPLSGVNSVFLKNSSEAIWQLQPVTSGSVTNTQDAAVFIISPAGPNLTYLSPNLLNSFEAGDQRMTNWVGNVTVSGTTYYYPFKYKSGPDNPNTPVGSPVTEYTMMLRLGEQYLIRAEARAHQGNISGTLADLNAIRNRAGLANYAGSTDPVSLQTAILHERQVELFCELGHRWLDLKRTKNVDAVMSVVTPQKGGNWQSNQQLYPLPVLDLKQDPNLKQNPGY